MADESQVAMLKRSVEEWNEWREAHVGVPIDLQSADLAGLSLRGANLRNARLEMANLSHATLNYAHFRSAELRGANLAMCKVQHASFIDASLENASLCAADALSARWVRADLSDANLTEADLTNASLMSAKLKGTLVKECNFTNALLADTIFANVDLSKAHGLDSCKHLGPSVLDHRTLVRSRRLPMRFLRGCGLPEQMIDYLPSLLSVSVQFDSCFISYSTSDQSFADRLYADLQNHGVRCWFAPHDILPGRKLHEQIDDAIRVYDRLLLILSGHSMASEWVKTEIANARQKELAQKRQVLFPISIVPYEKVREWRAFDADTGKDSARAIRENYIPDFTGWERDHARYKAAFDKLLKGLKAEDTARPGPE